MAAKTASFIQVGVRPCFPDAAGERVQSDLAQDLGVQAQSVRVIDVFYTDAPLSRSDLERLAAEAFTDPVLQHYRVNKPLATAYRYDVLVEVGFLPGVTDNLARTALESARYVLGRAIRGAFYTSRQYLFEGLTLSQARKAAEGLLCNPLIQRYRLATRARVACGRYPGLPLPRVTRASPPRIQCFDLSRATDEELERLSQKRLLALTAEEMRVFARYFERPAVRRARQKLGLGPPTDGELESFAQTQSEHCKHKVFHAVITYHEDGKIVTIHGLMDTFIRGATERVRRVLGPQKDFCVSVFKDNAGVIRFDRDWNLVFKVETHNAPSALDPYGGALTGIVGVNRDPLGTGLGCRLLFNTDVFCFASPYTPPEKVPPTVLHPKRVFRGVRRGVEHGGNQLGIPTVNGSIYFDDCYLARPLVYCGTGGIAPARVRGRPSHKKRAQPGDYIVMIGGRIGKDGIHGATFSSAALTEGGPATAVQIGAPIVQKRFQDLLQEAMQQGLYHSITDNGAGGLNSSVGEMARESGGAHLQLKNAPLKYHGLQPWEILLSEAQERMTLAVPPKKLDAFLALCRARDVEASVLGTFNDSGYYRVDYGKKTLVYLELRFLHEGLPRLRLEAAWAPPRLREPALPPKEDFAAALQAILSDLNVCSKEFVVRQYDHEVQGASIIKPLMGKENDGPSDAAVLKPVETSWRGVAVGHGIQSAYGRIDPYAMAACNIDEAVRNIVAVGADPDHTALLDNFCWPDPKHHPKTNPEGKRNLGALVRACKACHDIATAYRMPFISGKDSLSSDKVIEGKKYSIHPTLLISALGIVPDVRRAVSLDAKAAGDLVYVVGETRNELGGSTYYRVKGWLGAHAPRVPDPAAAIRTYRALHRAIRQGLVESCHDCSDGGLAAALAETAFSGGLGIQADLARAPQNGVHATAQLFFSESPSRFVVTVAPRHRDAFEKTMRAAPCNRVGRVTQKPVLALRGLGKDRLRAPLAALKKAWQAPLKW